MESKRIDCGCILTPGAAFFQCSECSKTFCERHWREQLQDVVISKHEDQSRDESICGICYRGVGKATEFDLQICEIIAKYSPKILESTVPAVIQKWTHERNAELLKYCLDTTAGRIVMQQQGTGSAGSSFVFGSGMRPREVQLEANSILSQQGPIDIVARKTLILIANLAASLNAHLSYLQGGR